MHNSRAIAAEIITKVIKSQRSLDSLLEALPENKDTSFIKELCFGTLRWYHQLDFIANQLLNKPLANKHEDIRCLLLIGLYQLIHLKTPAHAAVSESVAATMQFKKQWAKALINKTLRLFISNEKELLNKAQQPEESRYSHPQWLIGKIKKAWSIQAPEVLQQNNQRAPLTLRINQQKISTIDYLQLLRENNIPAHSLDLASSAIQLEQAVPVNQLPNFFEGFCSIQDLAGQLTAFIINPKNSQRILDACAAPGSKTTHLLELQPKLTKLVAIDANADRLNKLHDNVARLKLNTNALDIINADASQPESWWDGELFDSILLDAPCSGAGVIRRHPDIKILRHPEDIIQHVALQAKLLEALWPLLKQGGQLLYSTCSILPEENEKQISRFLNSHPDAQSLPIQIDLGLKQAHGLQILPGDHGADGFYYCLISKASPLHPL